MKILKGVPLLLLAALFIFAGCSAKAETPDTAPPSTTSTTSTSQPTVSSSPSQENASVTDQMSEQPSGQNTEEISYITAADAEAAALAHAGVTADDVRNLRSEFDYDNSNAEYDVDFYYNGYEYDYDINAVTGSIISFDKDPDN